MKYTDKYHALDLGQGWKWFAIEDLYKLNNGEFVITGSIVRDYMKDWGRKITPTHIVSVLNHFYRESQ